MSGINFSVDSRVAVFGTAGNGKSNFTKGAFKAVTPLFVFNPQDEDFPSCPNYSSFDSLYAAFKQKLKHKAKVHRYALVPVGAKASKLEQLDKLAKLCWELQYCTLLLDEIHGFVEKGKTPESIEDIARKGRKRCIRLVLTNQRAAYSDSEVVSQCNHFISFRVTWPSDVKYMSDIIPQFKEYNAKLPKFGFLYWTGELYAPRICNPVPWAYPSSNRPRPVIEEAT